jgi:hypothetical protein
MKQTKSFEVLLMRTVRGFRLRCCKDDSLFALEPVVWNEECIDIQYGLPFCVSDGEDFKPVQHDQLLRFPSSLITVKTRK